MAKNLVEQGEIDDKKGGQADGRLFKWVWVVEVGAIEFAAFEFLYPSIVHSEFFHFLYNLQIFRL